MVKIESKADYLRLLSQWARRTRSAPVDSWAGPGIYRGTGWMSDEWCPTCTLEKVPEG